MKYLLEKRLFITIILFLNKKREENTFENNSKCVAEMAVSNCTET